VSLLETNIFYVLTVLNFLFERFDFSVEDLSLFFRKTMVIATKVKIRKRKIHWPKSSYRRFSSM
jgi:hypothetical protein